MEIGEIKIGNHFEWSELASMGQGLDVVTLKNIAYHELMNPIELNEEWLVKMGLKKEKDRSMGFNYTNSSKKFKLVFYNGAYGLKYSQYYNIKHVHTLQNLYRALTETELNIEQ